MKNKSSSTNCYSLRVPDRLSAIEQYNKTCTLVQSAVVDRRNTEYRYNAKPSTGARYVRKLPATNSLQIMHIMKSALEHLLTNSYKADLIMHLNSHPKDFAEAIDLAISNKQPYSQKAAWLLWSCMKENDSRIKKYITQIIKILPDTNDSQLRELLIVLEKMKINSNDAGRLFDICVDTWRRVEKKPSVRYVAFRLMIKIAQKYPGLSHEIEILTDEQYTDTLSVTANKSIRKMMNKIKCPQTETFTTCRHAG